MNKSLSVFRLICTISSLAAAFGILGVAGRRLGSHQRLSDVVQYWKPPYGSGMEVQGASIV